MTIILDDVACLLGIPVAGRLIHEEDLDHDHAMDMLMTHLLFSVEDEVGYVTDFGASVSYTALKDRYDHLLNMCNHLFGEDLSEEEEEQELSRIRTACVKAFLLLLLGYTLFASKNSKTVSLLWMLAIRDLDHICTWSWGAMGLAFLYEQLNLTSDSNCGSVGGYMSLLVVIYFFFFF
jgi:hypothetical protein